jgi:hypothetical protein
VSLTVLVLLLAAVVVVAVVLVVVMTRRPKDAVDSFRRQIDALSPEARRGVVDQVQHAAGRVEPTADGSTVSGDAGETGDVADGPESEPGDGDEGGPRGT